MKKGLKVLSAAMAMSFAFAGSAFAFTGEKFVGKSESKVNPYYNGITTKDSFKKDAKAAQEAIEAVQKDTMTWTQLLTDFCEASKNLAEDKAELAHTEDLKAVANSFEVLKDDVTGVEDSVKLAQNKLVYKADLKAFKALTVGAANPEKVLATLTKAEAKEQQEAIVKKVDGYQTDKDDLLEVQKAYGTTEAANTRVAHLQGKVTEHTAYLAILDKFATQNGLTFNAAKCAEPALTIASPAKKAEEKKADATKKDVVPNTGAKVYFFAPEACPKAAEKVVPAFTFDSFKGLVFFVEEEEEAPAKKVVPAFSFESFADYELFAPCHSCKCGK